jgi:hypothetical protein
MKSEAEIMSNKDLLSALIAAFISSALFLLILGLGLGFLFMFLPALPLLTLGLGKNARLTLIAMLASVLMVFAGGNLPAALLYLFFLGLPSCYVVKEGLLSRPGAGSERQWYPVGLILTHLTIYACIFVALMCAYYSREGGMALILSQHIREAFSELEGDYGEVVDMLAENLSFMVFAITIWLWGMAFYAHGWLAQRVLKQKHMQQRPGFALLPFTLPGWMISLLAICALASLIGSPDLAFLGKSTLMSLLFPYFLSGAALLHAASKNWPSRGFFIFFIYFTIFTLFWPALIIAGWGFFEQIKHLSATGTSSKS